ncbi:MAG TPA: phosphoglycerate dehydrogenase [Balneolales bacterium]|nr:phosphoglycerate dehydrogenase [Balneolales bacterium]
MSYKILILDGVNPVCEKVFKERDMEAVNSPKLPKEELLKVLPDYDAMVVRSATKVTPDILKAAKKLKIVGRAGVGVDNIDIDAATQSGVLVMNTPNGNTISTAEHTCGMMLALARNIPVAVSTVKNGGWDRKKYMGTELHGKNLGIVGLGKIGSEVAARMQAFGMNILAFDPFTTHEKASEIGVELVELDDLLSKSDFLTVHTPLTDKTKDLISKKNAQKLKKGIRLINCARGGIYNEEDMKELLENGTIAGLAVDVYTQEPPSETFLEILKMPNVVCTPHLGASTEEAQEKVAEQVAQQIADGLEKKSYKGSLNGKSIALSTNKEVQPYLNLAEQLGQFAAQVSPKHSSKLSIEYTGKCTQYSDVLTDSLLKGYLQNEVDEAINLINARFLADNKGLNIEETVTTASKTYSDLITVSFENGSYHKISATLFGGDDFRIVNIDEFSIEIRLEGNILLYRNIDKPGMLSTVSTTLANEQINIASLSLGRNKKGTNAITAIAVDQPLSDDHLKPIQELDGVKEVRYINLN